MNADQVANQGQRKMPASQVQSGKPSNFTDIPLIFHIQNIVKNNLLYKNRLRLRGNSCSIRLFTTVFKLNPQESSISFPNDECKGSPCLKLEGALRLLSPAKQEK